MLAAGKRTHVSSDPGPCLRAVAGVSMARLRCKSCPAISRRGALVPSATSGGVAGVRSFQQAGVGSKTRSGSPEIFFYFREKLIFSVI